MRCHVPIPAAFYTLLPTQSIFFILVNIRIYSLRSQGASPPPPSTTPVSPSLNLIIFSQGFCIIFIDSTERICDTLNLTSILLADNFHGFSLALQPRSSLPSPSPLSVYMVLSRTLNLDMKVVASLFYFLLVP